MKHRLTVVRGCESAPGHRPPSARHVATAATSVPTKSRGVYELPFTQHGALALVLIDATGGAVGQFVVPAGVGVDAAYDAAERLLDALAPASAPLVCIRGGAS